MLYRFLKICLFICLSLSMIESYVVASDPESGPKKALVTGANRGIGFELTKQLLGDGVFVYAVARNIKPLKELKVSYSSLLHIIQADLSNSCGQKKVGSSVHFMLDYIVHNAAVIGPLGADAFFEASAEDLTQIIQVNVTAPIIITKGLANRMKEQTRLLFVSSRAGEIMVPGVGPYCVTKHAIDAFVKSLRTDHPCLLAATVHPGEVDTGMQETLRAQSVDKFALAPVFSETKKKGGLIPPSVAASFLNWLLRSVSDKQFVSKKHNIYEEAVIDPGWLPLGVAVTNPYPAGGSEESKTSAEAGAV